VNSYKADVGIAFDGNADHLVMVDEMGDPVMENTFRDGLQSAYSA
jgi:phosphomannomutase